VSNEVFAGWGSAQTINVMGHANQASADAAWDESWWDTSWRRRCNAQINYLGR